MSRGGVNHSTVPINSDLRETVPLITLLSLVSPLLILVSSPPDPASSPSSISKIPRVAKPPFYTVVAEALANEDEASYEGPMGGSGGAVKPNEGPVAETTDGAVGAIGGTGEAIDQGPDGTPNEGPLVKASEGVLHTLGGGAACVHIPDWTGASAPVEPGAQGPRGSS